MKLEVELTLDQLQGLLDLLYDQTQRGDVMDPLMARKIHEAMTASEPRE